MSSTIPAFADKAIMMISHIEVIPGIGPQKEFKTIKERVNIAAPYAEWLHIDIADGKLVPNKTLLDPAPFKELIKETGKNFELHMMIKDPLAVAEKWIDVGFKRLIFHVEGDERFNAYDLRFMNEIKKFRKKIEIGLAVDHDTPVDRLIPYLGMVDCVLVMTIKAGFSGQTFVPTMLDKVKSLRDMKKYLPIEVDGGINDETAPLSIQAGANWLVSTSYIYGSKNIEEAMKKLRGY